MIRGFGGVVVVVGGGGGISLTATWDQEPGAAQRSTTRCVVGVKSVWS